VTKVIGWCPGQDLNLGLHEYRSQAYCWSLSA